MKKEYQRPELEIVELNAREAITDENDLIDGSMDLEDSIFG